MKIRTTMETVPQKHEFMDREPFRNLFWEQFIETKSKPNDVHVLNYYGSIGIGKSRLLRQLQNELIEKAPDCKAALLDLNNCKDSLEALVGLRNIYTKVHGFSFSLFDYAYYNYRIKKGDDPEKEEIKDWIDGSPFLRKLFDTFGDVFLGEIGTKIAKAAVKGLASLQSWLSKNSSVLEQIQNGETAQIYQALTIFFIKDFNENSTGKGVFAFLPKCNSPFVIMLDSYDKLKSRFTDVTVDSWLSSESGLIQNIPRVFWVIAGRRPLCWQKLDPDWETVLLKSLLVPFSEEISKRYLASFNITDAVLCEQLYKLSGGVPLYLDYFSNRFVNSTNMNESLHRDEVFKQVMKQISEHIFIGMDDPEKDLLFTLSCFDQWDDSIMMEKGSQIIGNFSLSTYKTAKNHPFICTTDGRHYSIDPVEREILRQVCPEIIRVRVEKFREEPTERSTLL